jgi:hypothetical protein
MESSCSVKLRLVGIGAAALVGITEVLASWGIGGENIVLAVLKLKKKVQIGVTDNNHRVMAHQNQPKLNVYSRLAAENILRFAVSKCFHINYLALF